MRQLIVTGDDFGLAVPVNEAIEAAHRRGILTTASLMVGAEASEDAVARAQRLSSLKVGLHLVLVEGVPILSPALIPDLVDEHGKFSSRLVASGVHFFFKPGVRRQLESEITAQFLAFRKTGLTLDHVNAHNHMHLHPTILGLILKVGKEHGLSAIRLPYEPFLPSWRASRTGFVPKFASWALLFPWMKLLQLRLKLARVRSNDFVFGLHDSGHVDSHLVLRFLAHLPEGVTEIYFHPATRRCPEIDRTMPDYEHEREFEALINPDVKAALGTRGIRPLTFSEL
jgi:hopanoid biosynthesis associated protein HpnK